MEPGYRRRAGRYLRSGSRLQPNACIGLACWDAAASLLVAQRHIDAEPASGWEIVKAAVDLPSGTPIQRATALMSSAEDSGLAKLPGDRASLSGCGRSCGRDATISRV